MLFKTIANSTPDGLAKSTAVELPTMAARALCEGHGLPVPHHCAVAQMVRLPIPSTLTVKIDSAMARALDKRCVKGTNTGQICPNVGSRCWVSSQPRDSVLLASAQGGGEVDGPHTHFHRLWQWPSHVLRWGGGQRKCKIPP